MAEFERLPKEEINIWIWEDRKACLKISRGEVLVMYDLEDSKQIDRILKQIEKVLRND